MKRHFILLIASIAFLMHSYAQYTHLHSRLTDDTYSAKALHGSNEVFRSTMIINDKSRNMATSYIRVMRSFTFHFEKATNQTWFRHKKNFIVHFIIDGKKTNAVFNQKGKLLYSLSNCSEKDLPTESMSFISTAYYNYKIICVTEVYNQGENRLIVLLENDKSYVYLWWKNAQLQEPVEYQKFGKINF